MPDDTERYSIDIEDFKDFKNNNIYCDNCGEFMGCYSEEVIAVGLCKSCVYGIEELYKEKHPEEYD